eukprot:CAMPEP_0116017670 /NCGR_PEP_ID=MMETSP0321-20121206/8186_1 /TAXON_ID=163516 /ORGANISM="Leptocylindrus danicus var. danicus, Strain B650" /LENGTH=388 /DNA_ID=CAMNT_0003487907 /DNA_START=27 /DNA_END=1193 /DNA_ORIENTATION=+
MTSSDQMEVRRRSLDRQHPLHHEETPDETVATTAATSANPNTNHQTTTTNWNINNAARDALAGAAAGAFAKTAVAPIERVKLLMQLKSEVASNNTQNHHANRGVGALEVAKRVYREQGILAFWRGNTPNVLRQGCTAALNFMLMDQYKTAMSPILRQIQINNRNHNRNDTIRRRKRLASFLSGGLAGGTVTTILYPLEFLRTRLAMDIGGTTSTNCNIQKKRKYPRGMRDVFSSTMQMDGIRGLYQGYGIALAGVVVYRALHLGGYDALKHDLLMRRYHHCNNTDTDTDTDATELDLPLSYKFLAAQVVSLAAGTICYPMDSVRRRLMMQACVVRNHRQYRNGVDCFCKVWRQEGWRGFYLGIGPNIVRSVGGALLLVAYDVFKGMIY